MAANVPDPEDPRSNIPPAVLVREESEITTLAATHPLEERLERDNNYPLLKKVPIDQLPPRFQKLFEKNGAGFRDSNVEFFPTRIITCRPIFWVVPTIVLALIWYCGTGWGSRSEKVVAIIALVVLTLMTIGYLVYKNYKERSLLYAKDSNGVRRAWPGDWKIGVYLVWKSALLEFDGTHAWLFPMNAIAALDYFHTTHETVLLIRSPSETFKYNILYLEKPTNGRDIQNWYRDCIESSEWTFNSESHDFTV